MRTIGSPPSGLSLKMAKPAKANQKQAQQHGQRLDSGKGQPISALLARLLLSERSAQIVGRLCHGPPRISRSDDTTAGQARGRSSAASASQKPALRRAPEQNGSPSKKGGPKAALSQKLAG